MTTETIVSGVDLLGNIRVVNNYTWADLGSSPYTTWSAWTGWRATTATQVVLQLDDDLGSIDYRTPRLRLIADGDVTITLKISDTGTFTGEETTTNFVANTPVAYTSGRYYRWTITVDGNVDYPEPVIYERSTVYETRLYTEVLNDVDVYVSPPTTLSTNLGLVRNVQATALQGDDYVVDDYIVESQTARTAATLTNDGASIVSGYFNNAFDFQSNGNVRVAMAEELPQGTEDFTVEMRVYVYSAHVGSGDSGYVIYDEPDSAGGGRFIFSITDETTYAAMSYQVDFDGTSEYPTNSPSSLQISTNTWHHWAIVRDGADVRMYLNGTLVDTNTVGAGASIDVTTDFIRIGGTGGAGTGYFNGRVDELRISKSARYSGSSFTVPTVEFTNDPDTILLLHGEDYTDDGGETFVGPYIIEQSGGSPVINQKNPPIVSVVDFNGFAWDGTIDAVLRGLPKIEQLDDGNVLPVAIPQ